MSVSSFNGSDEVKTIGEKKYLYIRSRVAGKNKSVYRNRYSEDLPVAAVNQTQKIRLAKKRLRAVEKRLAELGYSEEEISPRVRLNIDFARANIKNLIYDQAILEGISTTFPQTETIVENGNVQGMKASDVQKILNLKRAWEFIVDPDVVASPSDFALLSYIAKLVNEGFYANGGRIRIVPTRIGGSSYVPPLPIEGDIREAWKGLLDSNRDPIDIAIEVTLFCMKSQIFLDGNKRASVLFANHYLIQKGAGLLAVPEEFVPEFKKMLVEYYEGKNEDAIRSFLKERCWRSFESERKGRSRGALLQFQYSILISSNIFATSGEGST